MHSIQGLRPEMEDVHRAVLGFEDDSNPISPSTPSEQAQDGAEETSESTSKKQNPWHFFGVFDGHGGSQAAEFSADRLYTLLAADLEGVKLDMAEGLRRALCQTELDWLARAREPELMDGTTAAVALIDRNAGLCVIGNVGDSEAILGTRDDSGASSFQVLTELHNFKKSDAEVKRVTDNGGRVWKGRLAHNKIAPAVLSLAVSRAIGDLFFKDDKYTDGKATGLTAEPHIRTIEVCGPGVAEQFLIIGCDGFWGVVSYEKATQFVFDRLRQGGKSGDPQDIAEALVHLARSSGSSDNITVMVIIL